MPSNLAYDALCRQTGDAVSGYHGRLELTWTNKDLRLLANEDGQYDWVKPSDWRVAEVRLLDDAGTVGDVGPASARAQDNLLIRGDALYALTSLIELPEFAREYVGKVKLVYLDPPFNTQQSFLQYDDALEHSVWLTMMRDRLLSIKTLLSPDGSVWVHCDDSEQAYLKVMMDEVFGRESFLGAVVWQHAYATQNNNIRISADHDYILGFAKDAASWLPTLLPRNEDMNARYINPDNDPRGPWKPTDLLNMKSASERPNLYYEITDPATGYSYKAVWKYERRRMNEMIAEGRIRFPSDRKGRPSKKTYLSEVRQGRTPQTWWPHTEVGHTQEAKREVMALFQGIEPFDTPKPERLLQRIIHIGSNPGDIVLDCFLGSGTTAAAAHKMCRRWIAVELEPTTINTYAVPRLTKVVQGDDPGGITKDVGWEGGGGFRILNVAPSMFEAAGGQVFLRDWATDSKLAEATAAQLGFNYAPDPPFQGVKGRTRLAVVDGLVNEDVVRILVRALPDDELLVVCGTAVDPAAGQLLRELRRGSRLRKIPQSILQEYRQPNRWQQATPLDARDDQETSEAPPAEEVRS